MTIGKAIKTLSRLAKYLDSGEDLERATAIKLGIEALKRVRLNRRELYPNWTPKLPGETKDNSK